MQNVLIRWRRWRARRRWERREYLMLRSFGKSRRAARAYLKYLRQRSKE